MYPNSEENLIRQHVSNIKQLADKANSGKDVEKEVQRKVDEAFKQLSLVAGNALTADLQKFRRQLLSIADRIDETQPKYRATLEYAAALVMWDEE